MPARLSGVQKASKKFDQLFLLSSLIEFWMKTLSAPALRQAALMRLMVGITEVAPTTSGGAPGVMNPVCMSMTRSAVRFGSMVSNSRTRPRLSSAFFTMSSSSFTWCMAFFLISKRRRSTKLCANYGDHDNLQNQTAIGTDIRAG